MAKEMAAQGKGWSSLPADLVNRVADCLLATNDLDCYTDLRAVCQHWRSVTADPKSNPHDPRFRPSRWVMLDEDEASTAAALLFVNTATGRFLRRRLPLLRGDGHAFVTSTTDGLLVLAASAPPHAVSVLNPFTGSLIRFAAPLPSEPPRPRLRLTADVVGSSPPALVLVSVGRSWVYWAEPQSDSFSLEESHLDCPASRLPQIIAAGGEYAAAVNRESVPAGAKNIFYQLLRSEEYEDCRCYTVVVPGGDMLAVLKRRDGMEVFKIDASGNVKERINSIGSLALFLGVRCIVVDADCFPTVEPNCAYFQVMDLNDLDDQRYIFKFSIGTCGNEEPKLVSAVMVNSTVWPYNFGPFTVTQLLCNYTMDIPGEQLMWQGWYSCLELLSYKGGGHCDYNDYIDYVNDESDEVNDESEEGWGSDSDYWRSDSDYD